MAIVINSNISSLTAQRALGQSQLMQQQAMERISTGLRINSAKDDAAGLAIAENFTSQIRGLQQAVRNANDGFSLAQTAEGGLQETTEILQRMRELAVQASNTTLTTSDRGHIQAEIDALTAEINRIADTTQYNQINILNGGGKKLSFQIGDKGGEDIEFSIASARANDLGLSGGGAAAGGTLQGGVFSGTSPSAVDDVLINGKNFAFSLTAGVSIGPDGTETATTISAGSAGALAAQINTNTAQHGVTASAFTKISGVAASGVTTGLQLTVTDFSGGNGGGAITIEATNSLDELVSAINNQAYGVVASKNSTGGIDLVSDQGNKIVVGGTVTGSGLSAGTYQGSVSLTSADGSDISISKGTNATAGVLDIINMGFNVTEGSQSSVSGSTIQHHANDDFQILASDRLTVNGVQIGTTRLDRDKADLNAADLAATINAVSAQTNVTASAKTVVQVQVNMDANSATAIAPKNGFIGINGLYTQISPLQTVETVVSNINTTLENAGVDVVATFSGSVITLTSETGANILLSDSVTSTPDAFILDGTTKDPMAGADMANNSTTVAEDYTVAGEAIDATAAESAKAVAGKINAVTATTGVTATAETFAHLFSSSGVSESYDIVINGTSVTFDISNADVSDAVTKINAATGGTGVTATATSDFRVLLHDADGDDIRFFNNSGLDNLSIASVRRDGVTVAGTTTFRRDGSADDNVRISGTLRLQSTVAFTTAQAGDGAKGYLTAATATQANANGSLLAAPTTVAGDNKDNAGNNITDIGHLGSTFGGNLSLTNTAGGSIVLGSDDETDAVMRAKWAVFGLSPQGNVGASVTGGVDLSTATSSGTAIDSIDEALAIVTNIRGNLGALLNRFEHSISNLSGTVENHSASRSRVMDADFAVESADLAVAQVLAQASTAILAQANAAPQLVMQLLQN